MTIETKYSIGEEVRWKTARNSGEGIVVGITAEVSRDGACRCLYKVEIQSSGIIRLVFQENDLEPINDKS
jgi:hypothetical protein